MLHSVSECEVSIYKLIEIQYLVDTTSHHN